MKQLLLILSFLLLTFLCKAQELHIVKDNLNCTYGIKDKSGNWVIEPNYILIQQYNSGYFLVNDVEGDGIVNPSGQWIVPCKYDRIETTSPSWGLNYYLYSNASAGANAFLCCRKGDKLDLISTQGVNIASVHSNDRIQFDGKDHFLIYASNPVSTSYIDTNGISLFDKKPGIVMPFHGREYSLWGEGGGYDCISGNGRLVNRTGEVILDAQFERARILTNDRIAYELNGCYGLMTTSGKVLIPPNYRAQNNLYSPEQMGGSWVIYDKNNRLGRMRSNGTIMIEPIYDEIIPIYRSNFPLNDSWQVKLNDKLGVIDSTSKLILPLEYDRIVPISSKADYNSPIVQNYFVEKLGKFAYLTGLNNFKPTKLYDSLIPKWDNFYISGLIAKNNGKYGILNSDGSVLVECIYTSHFSRDYDTDNVFLSNGKTAMQFVFSNNEVNEKKWHPFITDGAINIYTDSVRYWGLIFSASKNAFVGFDDELSYDLNEHLFMFRHGGTTEYRIYNRTTKRRIPIDGIHEIYQIQWNRYQIRTNTYKVGVMNSQGKVILSPIYTEIHENQKSPHLWVAKPTNAYGSNWMLVDSSGRQVLPNMFDNYFELNWGDQIASQNNRTGLIDSETLKWKIRPIYPCLFYSIGDYYVVLNEANKKGIIRNDGQLILEPIYDSIVLLTSNCDLYTTRSGLSPEIRWWVKSGNVEMLVDQEGQQTTSQKQIREFVESLFFGDTLLLSQVNQLRVFPELDYTPSLHFLRGLSIEQIRTKRAALWENPELKRCIFDTILSLWNKTISVSQSPFGVSYIWKSGEYTEQEMKLMEEERKLKQMCNCAQATPYRATNNVNFRLKAIGPQFVSVDNGIQNSHYNWGMEYGSPSYSPTFLLNFVMKNGKATEIQLKDIFPTDEVLFEEFIIALKKRDDLNLNCSSLEMMIQLNEGKFSLSESGVKLYLNQPSTGKYGSYSPEELLIPIENLIQHSETKWIVPILTNHQKE